MVQLGDPSFHWRETLVGVCGQLCHSRAAWWWDWINVFHFSLMLQRIYIPRSSVFSKVFYVAVFCKHVYLVRILILYIRCKWEKKRLHCFSLAAEFEVVWWHHSCLVLVELTHEFLQILEKTPSRLKRIRNWRVGLHCCSVSCIVKTCLAFNFDLLAQDTSK